MNGYLEPYWGKIVEDPRVPRGEIRMGSWDGPILMKNIGIPEANDVSTSTARPEPDCPQA